MFGRLLGTPVINQAEGGILGVGAVVKRPVVVETDHGDFIGDGHLAPPFDHRIVDGATAAELVTRAANSPGRAFV